MSQSSSSSISPLIVPLLPSYHRGYKAPERISEDAPPLIRLKEEGDSSLSAGAPSDAFSSASLSKPIACSVCEQHFSRYRCPRCQAPYCSVECYRNHARPKEAPNVGDSPCTEAFYKNRVSSILNLEAREQKRKTHELLNQQYQQSISPQDHDYEETDLSDQLYDMLQLLEERNDDKLSEEDIFAMMPPKLREEFQRDLQEGKIQELLLERWHPWWKRQLVSSEDSPVPAASSKTLDERLLRVPKFTFVSRKPQSPRLLLFHTIDILYSFCWTVRLYHGMANILGKATKRAGNDVDDGTLAVDAAVSLLQNSSVLNTDSRYTSLEQVLLTCTAASTKVFPNGCNAEWTVLLEDCASILASNRFVGRALLEVIDLFKAAIKTLKAKESSTGENGEDNISRLRQLKKKLEFFLSWSQHAKSEFGDTVKGEIMDWTREWKSGEQLGDHTMASNVSITELELPEDSGGGRSVGVFTKQAAAPFMEEVETKRTSK